MPLDTYTDLKDEIAAYISRGDLDTTAGGIDTYIDMAEAWFNRNLRVRQMTDSTSALTVTSGVITHPDGWRKWKQVVVTTTPMITLEITSEDAALRLDSSNVANTPQRLIVRGSSSVVWPLPDSTNSYTYRGIWYTAVPALSDANPTNWLLTAYPDAYLYGTLVQACKRIQDVPGSEDWRQYFGQVVGEIEAAESDDEMGQVMGSPVFKWAV